MDSARCQRGMEAPSGNPRQMHRSAGCKRQLGAFFLGTFLSTAWMQEVEQCRSNCRGQTKKSTSPSGARTRFKKIVAQRLINKTNKNKE